MGMIMVDDRRDEDHWRIDKRINISMVASVLAFLAGLVWWGANVETRFVTVASDRVNDQQKIDLQMQMVNQQIMSITKQQEIQFEILNRSFTEVKGTVNNLNEKIDKVIQQR